MINRNSSWSRPRRNHPLRTVLIGTSLEDESDQVVRSGLAVARATGGQVYLVHAAQIEPPLASIEAGLGSNFLQEQVAWRKEKLHQQIERIGIGKAELAGPDGCCSENHRRPHRRRRHRVRADGRRAPGVHSGPGRAEGPMPCPRGPG
jgi:hypothetical protein